MLSARLALVAAACLALAGCSQSDEVSPVRLAPKKVAPTPDPNATPTERKFKDGEYKGDKSELHTHTAPHGGVLVAIGEELAHIEVLYDNPSGKLTFYFLDAHASGSVRLAHEALALTVTPRDGDGAGNPSEVTMTAVSNDLTGEKAGDSSQFEGVAIKLKGTKNFDIVIESMEVLGQSYSNFAFPYPEGNDTTGGAH